MPSMRQIAAVLTGSAGVLSALLVAKQKQVNLLASSKLKPPHHSQYDHDPALLQAWDYNWDKMAPIKTEGDDVSCEPAKSKASRTLILIRHGQYVWDKDHPEKRILTELGRKQADITGKHLNSLGHSYSTVHYSTMPRATETAQIIRQHVVDVPSRSCDLMREGAPIRPTPMHNKWRPEEHEFFRDGPRIEAAFRKYFHRAPPTQTEDTVEVLVCHANVIRYFVCRALQLPPEAWLRMSLANGSVTKVILRPSGTVTLKQLGGSGHFPPDMVTFN